MDLIAVSPECEGVAFEGRQSGAVEGWAIVFGSAQFFCLCYDDACVAGQFSIKRRDVFAERNVNEERVGGLVADVLDGDVE